MKRRHFLAVSATGAMALIAGCSDSDETPTSTPTDNNETPPTSSPNGTDETPTDTDPDETPTYPDAPEDMVGISQFAFNHHQKNLRERPYTVTVESSTGDTSQTIDCVYNGEDKSFFSVTSTRDGDTTTIERFSAYGISYNRTNPADGDIQYDKRRVADNNEAYIYTGLQMIDQLTDLNVEVGSPEAQDEDGVYRYQFTNHPKYDSVSGFIELDTHRGVITDFEMEAQSADSSYSLDMEFTVGGQFTVEKPSWVEDMETETESA